MINVYRYTEINLAAAHAQDCTEGLYRYRCPSWIDRPHVSIGVEEGERLRCYVESAYELQPEGPLLNRGWVLQESLLPARVVYFGRDQVTWQCGTYTFNETFARMRTFVPNPYDAFVRRIGLDTRLVHSSLLYCLQHLDKSDGGELRSVWTTISKRYSRLRLKYPKDKLVAISGIVAFFAERREETDVYLAGLWKSELPDVLAWFCKRSTTKLQHYQAPSWSWVSLNTEVSWKFNNLHRVASYETHQLTPADGNDPFGQVTGGKLIIKAPILEFCWNLHSKDPREISCSLRADSIGLVTQLLPLSYEGGDPFTFLQWNLEEDEKRDHAEIAILDMDACTSHHYFNGVLLLPQGSSYRRAGFVRAFFNHEDAERLSSCPRSRITIV